VDFNGTLRATQRDIDAWEKKNLPYKLPTDLCAFYQMFDGFTLGYSTEVCPESSWCPSACSASTRCLLKRLPIEGCPFFKVAIHHTFSFFIDIL